MKEKPFGQRLRGVLGGAGLRHPRAGSTLPLVMIVSEGDTIRLKVKFDPQEEETWLHPAMDLRRSTPLRPILYTRLKSQTRVMLSLVTTFALISSCAPLISWNSNETTRMNCVSIVYL